MLVYIVDRNSDNDPSPRTDHLTGHKIAKKSTMVRDPVNKLQDSDTFHAEASNRNTSGKRAN